MREKLTWRSRRPTATLLLLIALGVSQPACMPRALKLTVTVDPDANTNSPVMLSIIVAYDKEVVKKLQELSAKQWFQQRDQLLRDHAKNMDEAMWEFVPGQKVPQLGRELQRTLLQRTLFASYQGIIFANYRSPGAHRYPFDPTQPVQFVLGPKSLVLQSGQAAEGAQPPKLPSEPPAPPSAP